MPVKGIHTFIYAEKESKKHGSYLKKMGFQRENEVYIKEL